jgi:hypothetical protein
MYTYWFSEIFPAFFSIWLAVYLAIYRLFALNDHIFAAVVVWALFAIGNKHNSHPTVGHKRLVVESHKNSSISLAFLIILCAFQKYFYFDTTDNLRPFSLSKFDFIYFLAIPFLFAKLHCYFIGVGIARLVKTKHNW